MKWKNVIKERLKTGVPTYGVHCRIPYPDVAEILSYTGVDWVLFDMEHGPWTFEKLQFCMQAMNPNCVPFVRVSSNDPDLIKRALDIGAQGILVPNVENGEDAIGAVKACRYPPAGIRGYGPRRPIKYGMERGIEYAEVADEEVLVMINIESEESINNLDEILSVEGIDAVFIGEADLSVSLFGPSGLGKRDSPKYKEVIQKILEAAERHGVSVRGHGPMRTIGFDDKLLIDSCKRALSLAKKK